jgi:hypothetical protein
MMNWLKRKKEQKRNEQESIHMIKQLKKFAIVFHFTPKNIHLLTDIQTLNISFATLHDISEMTDTDFLHLYLFATYSDRESFLYATIDDLIETFYAYGDFEVFK